MKVAGETVAGLLARASDDDVAFRAPGRPPLSYDALRAQADAVARTLAGAGVAGMDRVAIVLPNGPEMAAAFVCIAHGAVTAPLNPAYRAEEFDFYLDDLAPAALVVAEDSTSPALEVAQKRGLRLIRLRVEADAPAGSFTLVGDGAMAGVEPSRPSPDDVALILHTSGTTSRPKMVPLTHANVAASARHIGTALKLAADDHCLNIMPLFHIHGLIAAVLSTLAAGASVTLTPGFDALRFFRWLDEAAPSWYTAVPTMHQSILARAERNAESVQRARLRFIRSSSASLPPQVMAELETVFHCPVIESYGMTEAAHQMTSNPLPPRPRKPGSVGVSAGPDVAIMDEADRLLPSGSEGEVVISGPNVTPGYVANPDANAKGFPIVSGRRWFRTGDQGRLDDEGYLRITGRLKEIINRGGEKVSPLEVDEVLMDHPAIQQVVTFGMPHAKLGEDVAAAVVLREGMIATEQEIRAFAANRLADFKLPRRVVILDEIPKGATGKMQRVGLAAKLGLVP